ncbi:MAG: exodeoxyribonuclease VII small subunit [Prevotellaceae bacterium]|jgi:exodeoxyribonuclease VII small subunit|nr:exodeoxyribonuclease VII small subunit [Prevotellaceae bacterium]
MENDKPTTYKAAKAELEKIVNSLKQGKADVDHMVADVRRAAELLDFCRERLKSEADKIEEFKKTEQTA